VAIGVVAALAVPLRAPKPQAPDPVGAEFDGGVVRYNEVAELVRVMPPPLRDELFLERADGMSDLVEVLALRKILAAAVAPPGKAPDLKRDRAAAAAWVLARTSPDTAPSLFVKLGKAAHTRLVTDQIDTLCKHVDDPVEDNDWSPADGTPPTSFTLCGFGTREVTIDTTAKTWKIKDPEMDVILPEDILWFELFGSGTMEHLFFSYNGLMVTPREPIPGDPKPPTVVTTGEAAPEAMASLTQISRPLLDCIWHDDYAIVAHVAADIGDHNELKNVRLSGDFCKQTQQDCSIKRCLSKILSGWRIPRQSHSIEVDLSITTN
jgi:hypothetical protein